MADDNISAACSPNQNDAGIPCRIERRGEILVTCDELGCHPATGYEIYLASALAAAEAELERERMRLAACSTAALGYFNPDECLPEYRSAALQDVLTLRERAAEAEKNDARYRYLKAHHWIQGDFDQQPNMLHFMPDDGDAELDAAIDEARQRDGS